MSSGDKFNFDGKDYLRIDIIGKYNYFVNEIDNDDVCILKESIEDGKSYLVNLTKKEVDEALILYGNKHMNS